MNATVAIVGYTGFLGSALARAAGTPWLYNSANITEIDGKHFDIVVNAAGSSLKWKANRAPDEDCSKLRELWEHLNTVTAERFVHISTIDVMPHDIRWDERTPAPEAAVLQPYGRNRREFEEWVKARFPREHFIVRMPHLFGVGLKKNFVYDLICNPGSLHLTDARDRFCFYDVDNAWLDLTRLERCGMPTVNLAVEPMSAADVARLAFEVPFTNRTERAPTAYDMRTTCPYRHGPTAGYMYTREETIEALRRFRGVAC